MPEIKPLRRVVWRLGLVLSFVVATGCGALLAGADDEEVPKPNPGVPETDAADAGLDVASGDGAVDVQVEDVVVDTGPPSYPEVVTSDGPIAYWRFETGDLGQSETGLDYHLTTVDGPTQNPSGAVGGSLQLTGGPYLEKSLGAGDPLIFKGTLAFTIEAWVKKSAATAGTRMTLVSHYTLSGVAEGWRTSMSDVFFLDRAQNNDNIIHGIQTASFDVTPWHHVVAVYDGAQQHLYVDGDSKAVAGDVNPISSSVHSLQIGGPIADCAAWVGEIDEVAIYTKALPQDRINTHFRARTP